MKFGTRKDCIIWGTILFVFAFGYLSRKFWQDQFHIYILGKTEFVAEHYQNLPKDIDTIEIFTLEQNDNGNTNGFVGDLTIGTLQHKTLTGDDAREIVNLWSEFPIGRQFQAMCFDPVYGLQFKRNGVVYFQTSICWHCSGYTLPVSPLGTIQYGFDSKSKGAQKLLKVLEQHLPLPPEPIKTQLIKPIAETTNNLSAH